MVIKIVCPIVHELLVTFRDSQKPYQANSINMSTSNIVMYVSV